MGQIPTKEIAVVVQGAVGEYTAGCLQSLRQYLPEAQLILSTWEKSAVAGLDYDQLVLSQDPGGSIQDEVSGVYNNINRQLVSTKAGLALVQRKYCLKFRSGLLLGGAEFLDWFGRFDTPKTKALHFQQRLLVCNYYPRNPRILPLPFHLSDWMVFGLSEDLRALYNVPLQLEEEAVWFRTHEKRASIFTNYLPRFVPEQQLYLSFLRQQEPIVCEHYYDASPQNIRLTERFFAKDVVVLDYQEQLKLTFPKYPPNRYKEKYSLLSHQDWVLLYQHYALHCNKTGWAIYRMSCLCRLLVSSLRRTAVRFLGLLHLKEQMKRWISKTS